MSEIELRTYLKRMKVLQDYIYNDSKPAMKRARAFMIREELKRRIIYQAEINSNNE